VIFTNFNIVLRLTNSLDTNKIQNLYAYVGEKSPPAARDHIALGWNCK